ncbi:MAG: PilN domain-containing protein [Gemmatimonadales bacterium]
MITINLKPGHKRAAGKSSIAGIGAQLKAAGQKIKDPYRLGALAASVAWLGFVGIAQLTASTELSDLEPKLEQARTENQRFRAYLNEKRRLESTRDSIQAQIETIKTVDGDRYTWPRILDEVARAVPPYTWLTDVQNISIAAPVVADSANPAVEPAVEVAINGRTVDIQGYTRLLRQLEDSPYLSNVTAISANTVVDQNRAVTAFVLKATFQRRDAAAGKQAEQPAEPSPATTVAQRED